MNKEVVLEFVKKNVLSLTCAVIAVVSIGLIFYPVGGWFAAMQDQANTDANTLPTLTSLLSKPRKLPLSDPKADPGALPEKFPNQAYIDAGHAANDSWHSKTDELVTFVKQRNVHQQMAANLLGSPKPEYALLMKFRDAYLKVLSTDPTIHGVPDALAKPPIAADPDLLALNAKNLRNDVLDGALPPTQQAIDDRGIAIWHEIYEPQIVTQTNLKNEKTSNKQDLINQWQAKVSDLGKRMTADVARRNKMYVAPNAFTISDAIVTARTNGVAPLPKDVWYAQLGLWMQQDLVDAIAEANANSQSVLDSEVKQLFRIDIAPVDKLYLIAPPTAAAAQQQTTAGNFPFAGDEKVSIPASFALTPSGRYSNGMYDVLRFKLAVDVDASKVNQFIETLSQNRLITITNENLYAIDPELMAANNFFYGPGAAVRLQLDGEMLYMRSWTLPLMPDDAKKDLGLIKAGPGGVPGQPGGAGHF